MNNAITIAMVCDNMSINGISKIVENYAVNINKTKFEITILGSLPIDNYFYKVYEKIDGIKLITLPDKHKKPLCYYISLYKALKSEHYDIFHLHGNSINSIAQLAIAKYANIKVRIMHCHNTKCTHPIITKLVRPIFNYYCTRGFACGRDAGKWIWPDENFMIIPNGFNTYKFRYDDNEREAIRENLEFKDKIVLGHLGRINDQKNQLFLLDVFDELADIDERYVLLLVGTGPYLKLISDRIKKSKYAKRIKLYGEVINPEKIYSAMDIFLLPSKYEGLPVVLLEAQMSGLKCIVSDRVTREVNFGDIEYISIDKGFQLWCNAILSVEQITDRKDYFYKKHNLISYYDIKNNVKLIENIYDSMV